MSQDQLPLYPQAYYSHMWTPTCCVFHHSTTGFQTGNMSNCTEISTFYINIKYFELVYIVLSIFIIIPWTMFGFYTCVKNLRICTNSKCNVDTEINNSEVQKVYVSTN